MMNNPETGGQSVNALSGFSGEKQEACDDLDVVKLDDSSSGVSECSSCVVDSERAIEVVDTTVIEPESDTTHQLNESFAIDRRVGSLVGNIDSFEGGKVKGWLLAPSRCVIPVLLVNGRPVMKYTFPTARPDVNSALGIVDDTGFTFDVGGAKKGSKIVLYGLVGSTLVEVAQYQVDNGHVERNFILQLDAARKISRQEKAVVITCWEGAHNPIGRAKVLYDIVSTKRPAVIVTYIFGDFGEALWTPIQNTNIDVLSIPWANRERYMRMICIADIKFETVWVCKPRFPSFEIAKLMSRPNASVVLDFDDNEEHFSSSLGSRHKSYGKSTINYSSYITARITGRTSASVSLAKKFHAKIVRHARIPYMERRKRQNFSFVPRILKIGFIGTVRPHKNLVGAAKAIKCFSWATGVQTEFHVYGDISPRRYADELEDHGAVVESNVPMSELNKKLTEFDVVLTGYPSDDDDHDPVVEYQISSKIGDALAVGRPVLVPDSSSVEDLAGVEGVYLFSKTNFSECLFDVVASDATQELTLPTEFTLDGAYRSFTDAEVLASGSLPACEIFDMLPPAVDSGEEKKRSLVLLWKQNDANFYGRRIDQIARSYKRVRPNERVVILELLHENTRQDYIKLSSDFTSEHRMLIEQSYEKSKGKINKDGVEIQQILFRSSERLPDELESFLVENVFLPSETAFIIFPIVNFYETIEPLLRAYPKVMDVVDNQCSWGKASQQSLKKLQYIQLATSCDAVVFNSTQNRDYFYDNDYLKGIGTQTVIPNWYQLPSGTHVEDRRDLTSDERNVIYSGNLNDRIDWALMELITEISPNLTLHVVGTACRAIDSLTSLVEHENVIYHGPLNERNTLRLAQRMDVAVMPHRSDNVSTYMNPLKVHMFSSLGIHTVSTDVDGICASELLVIAKNNNEFLSELARLLAVRDPREAGVSDMSGIDQYLKLVDHVRNEKLKAP